LGTAITYSEDIKRVREDEIKKRRSKKAISFSLKSILKVQEKAK